MSASQTPWIPAGRRKSEGQVRFDWISLTAIVLAWHLLLPPIVYDKKENRFLWVTDATMADWYYKGEFKTYGECHAARQEEISKARKRLAATREADAPRRFNAVTLDQLPNSRCFSDQEVK